MKNNQISKKSYSKKKLKGEQCHYEGKYICNCRIRNYRMWLGMKLWGKIDET